MIDLHTHVLPGVDDGPADVVLSVAMADIAARDGVRILVATPHVRDDYPGVVPGELAGRVADLNEALARYELDVTVVPGGEVALGAALELDDASLRLVTLGQGGRDLLLETPHGPLPPQFEDVVLSVAGRGLRVVLAHPELNAELQAEPERLRDLAAAGVLAQVTAASLLLPRRSPIRGLAVRALEEGWAQVVASDAHAPRWREPLLGTFVAQAARAEPGLADVLAWATGDVPRALLDGDPLPERPRSERRRRWRPW